MTRLRLRSKLRARHLALLACLGAGLALPGHAQAAQCATSGPVGDAYTITVCISDPGDGAFLNGAVTVAAAPATTGAAPTVQRMVVKLDGVHLLTDYAAPYTFSLASHDFVDGLKTLQVHALMRDGFTSAPASISLFFQNGVVEPPVNPVPFEPTAGTTPAPGRPFVITAVGDSASGEPAVQQVVDLMGSWNPNMLLYLGDVYEKGTSVEFDNYYAPETLFGGFRSITNPTIGNHEYEDGVAPGYIDYWGSPPDYFSVDAGGWHLISLNSNQQLNELDPGTPQYDWLAADLANATSPCRIAFFHHPVFSVGQVGDDEDLVAVWSLLADNGVDIILVGHEHNYQRWVALDSSGAPSLQGTTQLVVGTGGHGVQSFVTTDPRLAAGFDTSPGAFGALRLELNPEGAGYLFRNIAGTDLDWGSVQCGAGADGTAPTAPTGLTGSLSGTTAADLGWTSGTDNVGVTGYQVYRNGALLASPGVVTTFRDTGLVPGTTYSYTVLTRDAAGNTSPFAGPVSVVTPPPEHLPLFNDGFESGTLGVWTGKTNVTVQQAQVLNGAYAARATGAGTVSWAYKTFSPAQTELWARVQLKVVSQTGTSSVGLLKLRSASGSSLLGINRTSSGKLALRNDVAGSTKNSTKVLSAGGWHELQVRLRVGASAEAEVWLDGVRVADLSGPGSFGTAAVGRLQFGENATGRTFDVFFDDATADTQAIPSTTPPDTSAPTAPTGLTATAFGSERVDLTWLPSTDNVGVTEYEILRDGVSLATVGAASTLYVDATVEAGTTYEYAVRALDLEGNTSALSSPASATTSLLLFEDGFETGDLSHWTLASGLALQGAVVSEGAWAARAATTGPAAYAYRDLAPRTDVYYRIRFNVVSRTATTIHLLRLRSAGNVSQVGFFLSASGKLSLRNYVTDASFSSSTVVSPGWHTLELHAVAGGAASQVETWYDGAPIAVLTRTESLGTTPFGRIQLGETSSGKTYDIAFDGVAVDRNRIGG